MNEAFRRWAAPMRRQLAMMVGRAIVQLVDDAGGLQLLQVNGLADETLDGVQRLQDYGFTSHPLPGAEGVLLGVGGARARSVVVAVGDRRYRLTGLAQGEVAIHDDQGQSVVLKRDGVRVETPFKVTIEAGDDATVIAPKVVIESAELHLGAEGGQGVARIGDAVSGGFITGGSATVKSA